MPSKIHGNPYNLVVRITFLVFCLQLLRCRDARSKDGVSNMTKRKGSKKPTGGTVGNHSSARKRAMIQPALDASALERKAAALAGREEQLKTEKEAFEGKQRVTTADRVGRTRSPLEGEGQRS